MRNLAIVFCLGAAVMQIIKAQVVRPPFNLLNRPETFLDTGNFIPSTPTVISEPPINSIVPIPNVVSEPSTTIITDCSPTICKNLANTIQLMIVCNLLQNSNLNNEYALQLAAPIINEVMSSPTLACGCANPIPTLASNILAPNVVSPSYITPGVVSSIPGNVALTPRVVSPNVPLGNQIPNTNCLLNTLMNLLGNVQGL